MLLTLSARNDAAWETVVVVEMHFSTSWSESLSLEPSSFDAVPKP